MTDHYDVVIVGAGASGAAAAWNLSKSNLKIVCLEQGDWVDTKEYPSNRVDWEHFKDKSFSPSQMLEI